MNDVSNPFASSTTLSAVWSHDRGSSLPYPDLYDGVTVICRRRMGELCSGYWCTRVSPVFLELCHRRGGIDHTHLSGDHDSGIWIFKASSLAQGSSVLDDDGSFDAARDCFNCTVVRDGRTARPTWHILVGNTSYRSPSDSFYSAHHPWLRGWHPTHTLRGRTFCCCWHFSRFLVDSRTTFTFDGGRSDCLGSHQRLELLPPSKGVPVQ